jgi:AcrR family transcriptional regulator
MEETRERIIVAGVDPARELKTWDWAELTFRAVAARAEVGERTVYRHFPTERALHAAIMRGLAEKAGVDYEQVTLDTVADTAARVFRSMGALQAARSVNVPTDPAFVEEDQHRRDALLNAVAKERPDWSKRDRLRLAAALDVLWGAPSYERLVDQWGFTPKEAMAVLSWAIERLVTDA